MERVNVSYLKNNLSAILARLKASARITVYDRNIPVAILTPVQRDLKEKENTHLKVLERAGIVSPPESFFDKSILDEAPPKLATYIDAVKLLLEDRQQSL